MGIPPAFLIMDVTPTGKSPHHYHIEDNKENPLEKEITLVAHKIIEIKKSFTPQGLPLEKVSQPFLVLTKLMELKTQLNHHSLNQVKLAGLSMRIDDLIMTTLDLFPTERGNQAHLDNAMKSYLFTTLYELIKELAYDSPDKEKMTDIIGQEMNRTIVDILRGKLQEWTPKQIEEGLSFASYIDPFVRLSLYMHPHAPVPKKGLFQKIATNDAEKYMVEYNAHYASIHRKDADKWFANLDLWNQMFPAGILMIWQNR